MAGAPFGDRIMNTDLKEEKLVEENSLRDNYVDVTYDESHHPFTEYPLKLANYLVSRYGLKRDSKLLDVGCGRGEFLKGFSISGLKVYGLDRSLQAKKHCPEAIVHAINLERDPFPFDDDTFDVVYNKSLIEHFYYPEKLVVEMHRVLKPGGLLIILTPDWVHQYKIFYDDFTHRTPFTRQALSDILTICRFKSVQVEKFRQLPFLWGRPFLNPLSRLIAMLTPRSNIKLIRFSKEVMLLGVARKG